MGEKWKDRPASIAEFEMLWDENKNLEIAKALILSLKDIEGLSLQEKLGFLNEIKIDKFSRPTLEVFLFLIPEWINDFQDYGWQILSLIDFLSKKINFLPKKDSTQGLESRIKKFVHSFLNVCKKENLNSSQEKDIISIMIHNKMFEELFNYDFIFNSHETVKTLWDYIFVGYSWRPEKYNVQYDIIFRTPCQYTAIEYKRGAHNLNYENKMKVREFLLSWDKVENRHALATLWTLLAKRGDLEKIFGAEKAEEIQKAE